MIWTKDPWRASSPPILSCPRDTTLHRWNLEGGAKKKRCWGRQNTGNTAVWLCVCVFLCVSLYLYVVYCEQAIYSSITKLCGDVIGLEVKYDLRLGEGQIWAAIIRHKVESISFHHVCVRLWVCGVGGGSGYLVEQSHGLFKVPIVIPRDANIWAFLQVYQVKVKVPKLKQKRQVML